MSEIILQVGVKVLLKNFQGKYLLVKRSQKAYPDPYLNELVKIGVWKK